MAQKTQAATPEQSRPQKQVNVVATRTGYHGLRRIREGQTFTIQIAEGDKLPSWVEPVGREGAASPRVAQHNAPPPPPSGGVTI